MESSMESSMGSSMESSINGKLDQWKARSIHFRLCNACKSSRCSFTAVSWKGCQRCGVQSMMTHSYDSGGGNIPTKMGADGDNKAKATANHTKRSLRTDFIHSDE